MRDENLITFLYSNTPQPPVLERIRYFSTKYLARCQLIHGIRNHSSLSLPELKHSFKVKKVAIPDVRGFDFRRIIVSYLFLRALKNFKGTIYALYPDMLLVALIHKLLNRQVVVLYEIQDLQSKSLVFRVLHNSLIYFSDYVFVTSPGFSVEYLPFLYNDFIKKTLFISNAPTASHYKNLEQYHNKKDLPEIFTIGFVGNLRDYDHLRAIENLLEKTKINILQAGASDFGLELSELQEKFPNRFIRIGSYHENDLSSIYGKFHVMWCAYPDTYNYRHHVARRLHEACFLGIPLVISEFAYGNITQLKENHIPFVIFRSDFNKLVKEAKELYKSFRSLEVIYEESYDKYNQIQYQIIKKIHENKLLL